MIPLWAEVSRRYLDPQWTTSFENSTGGRWEFTADGSETAMEATWTLAQGENQRLTRLGPLRILA